MVLIISMIISNSLGKNRQDTFSNSNVFYRSDGFKKMTKGASSSTKLLQKPPEMKSKLHTSTGFRRYTREYKIRDNTNMESRLDCSTPFSRVFTPTNDVTHRRKII